MTVSILQVNTASDSFGQWVVKTNKALDAFSYVAVTTNSNTTVGNAAITGTFTANSLFATSNVKIGTGTTNVVINTASISVRSGAANAYLSSSGLVVGGTTLYYQNVITMGNTVITTANVKADSGFFNSIRVGNNTTSFITVSNTGFSASRVNTNVLIVTGPSQLASIGTIEANVYITKDALEVYSNPTGSAVQNSKLTSTDLWVRRIHASELDISGASSGGGGAAGDLTANNIYGSPISFRSNTAFYANAVFNTSAYFNKGLFSNCNVSIGNNFVTPESCLHIRHSAAVTNPAFPALSLLGINSKTSLMLESNTDNFIEYRSSVNTDAHAGMIFVDDNQAGYVAYQHGGAGQADKLRLGVWNAVTFEVGQGDILQRNSINYTGRREVMKVSNTALTLNNATIVLKGSTSGEVTLRANAEAGFSTFTLPSTPGAAGQAMLTDGTGKLYFGAVAGGPVTPTTASPLASSYVVRGKITSNTTVATGIDYKVPFIDDIDPNNWHDASTNRFRPTIAGYYRVDTSNWFNVANQGLGGGGGGGGATASTYIVRGTLSGNIPTVSNIEFKVPFIDDHDPNGWHNSSNNRFQPSIAGWYRINAAMWVDYYEWEGRANYKILKNGTEVVANHVAKRNAYSEALYSQEVNGLVYMNGSTDYIEFYIWPGQNYGGNSTILASFSAAGQTAAYATNYTAELIAIGGSSSSVAPKNSLDTHIKILKNNSEVVANNIRTTQYPYDYASGTIWSQDASALVYMNGTSDYLEFYTYTGQGTGINVTIYSRYDAGGQSIPYATNYTAELLAYGGGGGSLSSTDYVRIAGLGVGVPFNPPTAGLGEIRAGGNITAYYSDERLKENITPLSDSLEKITQLRGVTFNSNDVAEQNGYHDKSRQVGVIAQDVAKVLPEAVKLAPFDTAYDEEQNEVSKSGENYLTVQYEKIVPLLIEAIKELKKEIEELKAVK